MRPEPTRPGKLFLISAPSGTGKTTLIKALRDRFPWIAYSVSHTTRPPRNGEVHGIDYFFIDDRQFRRMIDANQWLEWARVHAHYYGTSRDFVREQLANGQVLLLDIDVQGARRIMGAIPDAVSVFVMPPSLDVLAHRLKKRGTDDPETIALRLKNAEEEIRSRHQFHHQLVNDDLETATDALCTIFLSELADKMSDSGD